jgi:hypothetical protein
MNGERGAGGPVGQMPVPEDRHATVSPRAPCARLCLRPPFRLAKFDVNFSLSGVHWALLASAWPASAPQFRASLMPSGSRPGPGRARTSPWKPPFFKFRAPADAVQNNLK